MEVALVPVTYCVDQASLSSAGIKGASHHAWLQKKEKKLKSEKSKQTHLSDVGKAVRNSWKMLRMLTVLSH